MKGDLVTSKYYTKMTECDRFVNVCPDSVSTRLSCFLRNAVYLSYHVTCVM